MRGTVQVTTVVVTSQCSKRRNTWCIPIIHDAMLWLCCCVALFAFSSLNYGIRYKSGFILYHSCAEAKSELWWGLWKQDRNTPTEFFSAFCDVFVGGPHGPFLPKFYWTLLPFLHSHSSPVIPSQTTKLRIYRSVWFGSRRS